MRRPILLLACGIAAAGLGGFLVGALLGLMEADLAAIIGGLFLGLVGAIFAIPVAAIPAMLLGGLLMKIRVRHRLVWAATGAAAGPGCLALGRFFPGAIGDAAVWMSKLDPMALAPAIAVAGALAALFFRALALALDDEPMDPRPA